MRLVFAGTPQVAADTLAYLLTQHQHEVVAVLTRPDAPAGRSKRLMPSPVAQLATEHGIEVLRPARATDPALAARLADLAPDCCPVVAYGNLIPSALLDLPQFGWVNVHYSLLPRWRGAAPVQRAIWAQDATTGVSVFQLVPELDAGAILAQTEYVIQPGQTAGELLAALEPLGATLLGQCLDGLQTGELTARAQPSDGVTLAPKITVADARIDWAQPAIDIAAQIRACNPTPMAWAEYDSSRLRVLRAQPSLATDLDPGELLITKRTVRVGTGAGCLQLDEVQPAGKKAIGGPDWARGLRTAGKLS